MRVSRSRHKQLTTPFLCIKSHCYYCYYIVKWNKMNSSPATLIILLSLTVIGSSSASSTAPTIASTTEAPKVRSFGIGYNENAFLMDGKPFRYISGTMHYFRVPIEYWKDRMLKMKAAGLNTLQTYIEWASHEPEDGQYDFSGNLDLVKYLQMAQSVGLYVILRPGPFIDSERDFGGFPYWLLSKDPNMKLRTNDEKYMHYVERYFVKLFSLLKPLLYINGGPVLMLQVENEYGSYFACDRDYVQRLAYIMRQNLGFDVQLFTTDGNADFFLKCGRADGIYSTIDFGANTDVNASFEAQRIVEPFGPLVNSEFYPGWIDHWNEPHSKVAAQDVAKTLDQMLAVNASVNIYVFHGGTSFGYGSGSHDDGKSFTVTPTSYDFDAPMNEAGDLTPKYYALQEIIKKYENIPDIVVTPKSPKMKFGPVNITSFEPMIQYMKEKFPPIQSPTPKTFEQLNQFSFCVGYETQVNVQTFDPTMLTIKGIRDRGYVFVDEVFQGILSRELKVFSLPIMIRPGQKLTVIVENQGRVCYGNLLNDIKGITGEVLLDGKSWTGNWTMYPFREATMRSLSEKFTREGWQQFLGYHADAKVASGAPGVYSGSFVLPTTNSTQADTFLKLDGWTKGVAYINGHNLGRYWPVAGPQVTLYVPGVWLSAHPQMNRIVLVELERSPCNGDQTKCVASLVDAPEIDGPTPPSKPALLGITQEIAQPEIYYL